jgi:hypothetical protein
MDDVRFRRDFETVEDYRKRVASESLFDEPVTCETDIAQVLDDEPLSPWVVDRGPLMNTRRDEAAIQAAENRVTELDQTDRYYR